VSCALAQLDQAARRRSSRSMHRSRKGDLQRYLRRTAFPTSPPKQEIVDPDEWEAYSPTRGSQRWKRVDEIRNALRSAFPDVLTPEQLAALDAGEQRVREKKREEQAMALATRLEERASQAAQSAAEFKQIIEEELMRAKNLVNLRSIEPSSPTSHTGERTPKSPNALSMLLRVEDRRSTSNLPSTPSALHAAASAPPSPCAGAAAALSGMAPAEHHDLLLRQLNSSLAALTPPPPRLATRPYLRMQRDVALAADPRRRWMLTREPSWESGKPPTADELRRTHKAHAAFEDHRAARAAHAVRRDDRARYIEARRRDQLQLQIDAVHLLTFGHDEGESACTQQPRDEKDPRPVTVRCGAVCVLSLCPSLFLCASTRVCACAAVWACAGPPCAARAQTPKRA
jgi:hypothetical protein